MYTLKASRRDSLPPQVVNVETMVGMNLANCARQEGRRGGAGLSAHVRGRNRGARAHSYLIGVHTRRCWERPSQALGRGKEEEDGNDSEGRRRVVAFAHA